MQVPRGDRAFVVEKEGGNGRQGCGAVSVRHSGEGVEVFADPVDVVRSGSEGVRQGAAAQEAGIRRHAAELRVGERVGEGLQGLFAGFSVHDQFGDHGIVI